MCSQAVLECPYGIVYRNRLRFEVGVVFKPRIIRQDKKKKLSKISYLIDGYGKDTLRKKYVFLSFSRGSLWLID